MYRLGEWLVDPTTRRIGRENEVVRVSPKAIGVLDQLFEAQASC